MHKFRSRADANLFATDLSPENLRIGRDPREVPVSDFQALGHLAKPLMSVIRAKCLDCSHTSEEVRKCTAFDCPLWPYRCGVNPFRKPPSDKQREAGRKLAEVRARLKEQSQ